MWRERRSERVRVVVRAATATINRLLDRLLADAHRLVAAEPSPFELARTELCLGERLRREHRRVEARCRLDEALERFQALAAWVEKAARELGASGARARRAAASSLADLTPRERDVLERIAEGRSNRAIAQRLFLSEKTVEGNVRRIFDKLHLTETPDDNRRVLAVVAFLRGDSAAQQ